MAQERQEDVSEKGLLSRMGSAVTGIFARFGLCTVKVICAVLLAAIAGVKFVFREMLSFLIDILHGALWLLKEATESIRARIKRNKELQLASKKAKKQGRGAYITSCSGLQAPSSSVRTASSTLPLTICCQFFQWHSSSEL